jgi:putative DNA primase/helicase
MSQLHEWARALGGEVSGQQVLCPGPGHSRKDRSLSVRRGRDGEPVVHSFAEDDWRECKDHIRQKLGLEEFKPNGNGHAELIIKPRIDPAPYDPKSRFKPRTEEEIEDEINWQIAEAAEIRIAEQQNKAAVTVMQDADTLEMEIIEWLWLHWLAKGKLHLIAGAPEAGKTTIALSLAATISSGSYWPDTTRAPAGNILIWTSEDSLADTITPRLVRMGADLSRIKFIIAQRDADGKTRPFNPSTDMSSLIEAAKKIKGGVQLLIVDPIVATIGSKTNSHNNAETRNSLQPVVDFAEAANCAVLGISHFTKGTAGKDPIERVTGSLAFGALPRIVFAAAKTDETAEVDMPRIFVRAKSNIGPSGGGFGYDIDAAALVERPDIVATRIVWLDPLEGTARDLLDAVGPQPGNTKTENAEIFLLATLPQGEKKLQAAIETEATANGISKATLRRAKTAAKVKSTKAQGAWWWCRD